MQTQHLSQEYTDQAIDTRYRERVAAAISDLKLDGPQGLNQHPVVRDALSESMRRDYCIQVALRENRTAQLKTLLDP